MKLVKCIIVVVALMVVSHQSKAQGWVVGGSTGLSVADGNAGFHIGPMAEYMFNKNMSVGTDFTINTQAGTPIAWWNYYKYHFSVPGSKVKPYADGGMLLEFVTGGPYFGLLFGGGVDIPVASKLFVAPEFQAGPIFSVGGGTNFFGTKIGGTTIFTFVIRGSVHYEI